MLETFYETFKMPHESLLDKLWHKSFSMDSKRGHSGQKIKVTKKVKFWNLIMIIIYGYYKNAKIIPNFQLGGAALA